MKKRKLFITLGFISTPIITAISCGKQETFAEKYLNQQEGNEYKYIKLHEAQEENGVNTFTLDLSSEINLKEIPDNAFVDLKTRKKTIVKENTNDKNEKEYKNIDYYLTEVIFPPNLTKIGKNAFRAKSDTLSANQRIKILDFSKNEAIDRIENFAFIDNSITTIKTSGNFNLPNSLSFIGEEAFKNNDLTTLNTSQDSQLRFIDIGAFQKNKLTTLDIQSLKLEKIRNGAFAYNQINQVVFNQNNENNLKIENYSFLKNSIKENQVSLPKEHIVEEKAFDK